MTMEAVNVLVHARQRYVFVYRDYFLKHGVPCELKTHSSA